MKKLQIKDYIKTYDTIEKKTSKEKIKFTYVHKNRAKSICQQKSFFFFQKDVDRLKAFDTWVTTYEILCFTGANFLARVTNNEALDLKEACSSSKQMWAMFIGS